MPVKRRLVKGKAHRITPEAVEAWKAGDFGRLHCALGLAPWEMSPLPEELTPLGVGAEKPSDNTCWTESWEQARELQLLLLEEAPAPTCEAD